MRNATIGSMEKNKIINYWLEGAKMDWLACQHLYESKDFPQCLFWGHLILEKLLKAHVVQATSAQSPYSHDLVLLAKKADIALSQEQRDHLNEITTFNQFGRYDNEVMTFLRKCNPAYVEKYFTIIKNLYLWLSENLQKKS